MNARTVTVFVAAVMLFVGVASIVATCQPVRADPLAGGSNYFRPGIQCAMARQAARDLAPHGYELAATLYRTEYGPGWFKPVPVVYVFTNRETGDSRRVDCLGAPRSLPVPARAYSLAERG